MVQKGISTGESSVDESAARSTPVHDFESLDEGDRNRMESCVLCREKWCQVFSEAVDVFVMGRALKRERTRMPLEQSWSASCDAAREYRQGGTRRTRARCQ